MRFGLVLAAAAISAYAPAAAQYQGDPGYGGGYGYPGDLPDERDYGTQPPPSGRARPLPDYRDDDRWTAGEDVSSGDARRDDGYRNAPPPPPPPATGNARAYRQAQSDYRTRLDAWNRQYGNRIDPRDRARIDRWRARADACEAGDRAACDGPE